MAAREREHADESRGSASPLRPAALAAGLLEESWSLGFEASSPRAEVTRDLASGLRTELETLAGQHSTSSHTDALLEGALRAADVANLAAASLAELPEANTRKAAAATHLAAGAARALCALVGGEETEERAEYSLKDARSAAWRAGLAARQADEALEGIGDVARKA